MADSLSSSSCADTEDRSSVSSPSLSVGYYPGEDTFSYENTASHEDTFAEGPSIHSVPPFQGSWQTDTVGRLLEGQDHVQDDPEQFCQRSITLACGTDMSSDHSDSVISWGLHGDNLWINKYPKEKTQLTLSKLNGLVQKLEQFLENQRDDKDDESVFPEPAQKKDVQLFGSTSLDMTQVSRQERDPCQGLPALDPPANEVIIQFSQVPPRIQEHELAQVSQEMPRRTAGDRPDGGARAEYSFPWQTISQTSGSHSTGTAETSPSSSDQLEEGDRHSSTQAHSCLNVRWAFHWLRQKLLSFWGRQHPKKATKYPCQLTQKKTLSHRSKRIQPQEYIELEHPVLPDFKTC
ncbi:uncharacterized protein C12orf71 homolog [Sturnira hondurensis]|uniref:uncharacterized protein C12orf71 homolog n=1 Tax=Sturnira hondurensis TaxID=192404 RepID=UPI00187A8F05|nr:uncharacterized protein C12orf71 homolog [Sturnira hondurensis]